MDMLFRLLLTILIFGCSAAVTAQSAFDIHFEHMRRISGMFVGRNLNQNEIKALKEKPSAETVRKILTQWVEEPFFALSVRTFWEGKLATSGMRDGIDYNLPGNLVEYLVAKNRPYHHMITADYCISADGEKVACDTGAQYEAGVLTTRGFLSSHKGRFNLSRAGTLMRAFMCYEYPMPVKLEPPVKKSWLIRNFQLETKKEVKEHNGETFGNGEACYTCHSQFAPHSQLFVRYDTKGFYKEASDLIGKQDPSKDLGTGFDGLAASHYTNRSHRQSEASFMLGQAVDNLADAAEVLKGDPRFLECGVRNALVHILRTKEESDKVFGLAFLTRMAKSLGKEPAIGKIYSRVFSQDYIIYATRKK